MMHSIPDATTVALFRGRLRQAGVTGELFQMLPTLRLKVYKPVVAKS
ncbi:MAG: hypothetical protein F4218_06050 [Synechococcus sp. SB0677_bin_5]|nr:hypothetical protein [Synechococcus sp. SB0677_bin_5]